MQVRTDQRWGATRSERAKYLDDDRWGRARPGSVREGWSGEGKVLWRCGKIFLRGGRVQPGD